MVNDVSLRCGYCDKFLPAIEKDLKTPSSTSHEEKTCSTPSPPPPQKPIFNLPNLIFNREMGFGRGSARKAPSSLVSRPYTGSFTCGQRVLLNNQFIPNQRRRVDMVKSKTFVVSYIENGEALLTASQGMVFERLTSLF